MQSFESFELGNHYSISKPPTPISHKAMLELWVLFGRMNNMNFNIVLGWGDEGAQVD